MQNRKFRSLAKIDTKLTLIHGQKETRKWNLLLQTTKQKKFRSHKSTKSKLPRAQLQTIHEDKNTRAPANM